MEDIKVGEYARTVDGLIGKIEKYENGEFWIRHSKEDVWKCSKDFITKHSFNLTDLVDEKDIVKYQVNSLSEIKDGNVRKYKDARDNSEYLGVEKYDITKIYILSILTHELYEANCYKVKGE